MKVKFNWMHLIVIVLVAGGLILITKSFFMSLGIMLLLFVADYFLRMYDERHGKKDDN